MKHLFGFMLILMLVMACNDKKQDKVKTVKPKFTEIIKADYELCIPKEKIDAVLVLFGGYPEHAVDIRREFKILDAAMDNNIAILFMNYNQRLWLEEKEKIELSEKLRRFFLDHQLPTDKVHIGGFSSGGNVSLLIGNYLMESNHIIQPKGVFIADSPIDLLQLYHVSSRNIKRNYSELSVQESSWIVNSFDNSFGNPDNGILKYEQYSPFTSQSNNIQNISNLNSMKIRLYTEPDTLWWKNNRMNDPKDLNAYSIEQLALELKSKLSSDTKIEFIATKNRGYRANGDRHPHSWSIVQVNELVQWILKD